MSSTLLNVFKSVDLKSVGKTAADIISLSFKINKKAGPKLRELY